MPGIVVASANGNVGIGAAIEVLRSGGTAVDAVVAGIELVEANPLDHSVGYSGLPNLLGEVELDASIMDGAGLRAGSVGALHGYQDAVTLARIVMDTMPHVLIVGAGLRAVEAEIEENAATCATPLQVLWHLSIRRAAPALAIAAVWIVTIVMTTSSSFQF